MPGSCVLGDTIIAEFGGKHPCWVRPCTLTLSRVLSETGLPSASGGWGRTSRLNAKNSYKAKVQDFLYNERVPKYSAQYPPYKPKKRFSFYLFWLVFWLTVTATLLMSWQLLVVPADWSPFAAIPDALPTPSAPTAP